MAVIQWKETGGDELTIASGFEVNGTRTFLAHVDRVRTAKADILAYRHCPRLGQAHRDEPRAICDSVRVFRRRDSNWWLDVVAQYASNRAEDPDDNPLQRPARIDWSTQRIRVLTQFDRRGRPMLNTAGELMAPVERNRSLLVANVEKLMAQVPRLILDYEDCINSDTLRLRNLTFPKHTLYFDGLTISDLEKENDVWFHRVRYRLTFRSDTWLLQRLSTGFNQLITQRIPVDEDRPHGAKKTVRHLQAIWVDGQPVQKEQLLDAEGRWIEPIPPANLLPGDPAIDVRRVVKLKFELDEQQPFARLGLR